jgi:prolyl-tRNA synthetase
LAGKDGTEVTTASDALYKDLQAAGIEVLYDDRDKSAGEKFADSDLLGIPARIVISKKTIEKNILEYKERIESNSTEETVESILNKYA